MIKQAAAVKKAISTPQCSIVIPTCNRHNFLLRAVKSAQEALPAAGEIVVVDDGTKPACEALAQISCERLRVITNPGPHGASAARNLGVRESRAELVLFLDDDDELMPNYPTRVTELCEKHVDAVWGFAPPVICNMASSDASITMSKLQNPLGLQTKMVPFRRKLIPTSSGFWIRKSVFHGVGGFDAEQKVDEDTDLCCRLLAAGYEPWCEGQPGTRVYRGWTPEKEGRGQLTATTDRTNSTECYRRTLENNAQDLSDYSGAVAYLAVRYLRRAAKEADRILPERSLAGLGPWPLRLRMRAFWLAKRAVFGLRKFRSWQ